MKENSIEETKKQLELILKVRKEQKEIIECAGGSCMNCDPDIRALTESIDILSDYKRVLKENERYRRSDYETICLENNELRETVDRIQSEYNDLLKEHEKLKAKIDVCNWQEKSCKEIIQSKYISIQKVKDKIEEEKLPLTIVGGRKNKKTLEYGIKLGRRQALQELIEERKEK